MEQNFYARLFHVKIFLWIEAPMERFLHIDLGMQNLILALIRMVVQHVLKRSSCVSAVIFIFQFVT